MSAGVLYWNHGVRCLARLLVSITSLRRHYDGPVALLNEGPLVGWVAERMTELKVEVTEIQVCHDFGLVKKSRLWRLAPWDRTLFLDSDTLVMAPVDPLFAMMDGGCVVTAFSDWGTSRGRMGRRIRAWSAVAPQLIQPAVRYGRAINTGVMGWVRGDPLLPAYESLTAEGLKARCPRKTLDEVAMQLLAPAHRHVLAGSEWNASCTYSDPSKAKIIHYHGHKHVREGAAGDLWRKAFMELSDTLPRLLTESLDPSVDLWLRKKGLPEGRLRDVTIVTAVNPPYAEKLRRNMALWMKTPGLMEQQFLVFVHGFRRPRDRAWLDQYPNVRVVRWDYPFPDASPRETMLSSFVLGTARHVRTDFWMKLDADTRPVAGRWDWPRRFRRSTVTSHKWGYTKCKADPGATRHWFNRLDDVFANGSPMFRRALDPVADFRVSHRRGNQDGIPMRFASFAHIERTTFTRRIAAVVELHGGRLPIPSHDTLAWYCATLWRERVELMDMRKHFNP